MSFNINKYDIDSHIAEIYDQIETETEDVDFIIKLIKEEVKTKEIKILEPFCGTGRILIPLAEKGYKLVGIEQSKGMLNRAIMKAEKLPEKIRDRITFINSDVIGFKWPDNCDLVLLGGNCFNELATPAEQENCIFSAWNALKKGGYLYVENDNMEGELAEYWYTPKIQKNQFPTGICSDESRLETTTETIEIDKVKRIWKARREITIYSPEGSKTKKSHKVQCHPIDAFEVKKWLEKYNFEIIKMYSTTQGDIYYPKCKRIIFWAKKN
jgi:SAM-dependent methyltransferase